MQSSTAVLAQTHCARSALQPRAVVPTHSPSSMAPGRFRLPRRTTDTGAAMLMLEAGGVVALH